MKITLKFKAFKGLLRYPKELAKVMSNFMDESQERIVEELNPTDIKLFYEADDFDNNKVTIIINCLVGESSGCSIEALLKSALKSKN